MDLNLNFAGGLELLFDNQKSIQTQVPANVVTIKDLIQWTKSNLLKERPELFVQDDSVRPGILVLINEADWELEGGLEYKLSKGDNIVFISTLHGG